MLSRRGLDETAFYSELASHISGRIGSNRDILLYIHGFKHELRRGAFPARADRRRRAFRRHCGAWPAVGSLLDYGAAKENATAARDTLTKLIQRLADVPDVGRVHILAHSMSAWLAMEALREMRLQAAPTSTASSATLCSPRPTLI